MLRDGATWLAGQLQDHAGDAVVFCRGATEIPCTAVRNRAEYEIQDELGLVTQVTVDDFTFVAADLVIGESEIEPRPGDLVKATVRGATWTFEVMDVGSRRCCEFADASGVMLLVHTKRIN